jgi:hypothetical protein
MGGERMETGMIREILKMDERWRGRLRTFMISP